MTERFLEDCPAVDWNDFQTLDQQAGAILQRLWEDRSLLWHYLEAIADDPALSSMCESIGPFDKLVLFDDPGRQFRIRLHLWNVVERERAHQHRFSFVTRLLTGSYEHTTYVSEFDSTPDDDIAAAIQGSTASFTKEQAKIQAVHTQQLTAGDGYALHHSAFHSTTPTPGTTSLFLRGPAVKESAPVADLGEGALYWRFGRNREPNKRVKDKVMSRAKILESLERLRAFGI